MLQEKSGMCMAITCYCKDISVYAKREDSKKGPQKNVVGVILVFKDEMIPGISTHASSYVQPLAL